MRSPKSIAQQAELFGISESLRKHRGRITMPGLSNMTRPDQQVRTGASPRQKEIAARVFANQMVRGSSRYHDRDRQIIATHARERGITNSALAGVNMSDRDNRANVAVVGAAAHLAIREHEGFHHLVQDIRQRHGNEVADEMIERLIGHIHPEDRKQIEEHLRRNGYSEEKGPGGVRSRGMGEEIINRVRDALHHAGKRYSIKEDSGKPLNLSRLANSWQRMRKDAKTFTPEMFRGKR